MTDPLIEQQPTDFNNVVTLTLLAGLPTPVVVELAEWTRENEPDTPMLDVVGRELRAFLSARRTGNRYSNESSPLYAATCPDLAKPRHSPTGGSAGCIRSVGGPVTGGRVGLPIGLTIASKLRLGGPHRGGLTMVQEPRECSIANALEVIGERWSLLVLREAFFGVHRFDDIARNTGASRDILAARLKTLVQHGILEKRLYNDRPKRYEYQLTEAGRALHTVLLTLMDWGDTYVTEGPPPVTWTHRCGATFKPALTCKECGQPAVTGPEDLQPQQIPR